MFCDPKFFVFAAVQTGKNQKSEQKQAQDQVRTELGGNIQVCSSNNLQKDLKLKNLASLDCFKRLLRRTHLAADVLTDEQF